MFFFFQHHSNAHKYLTNETYSFTLSKNELNGEWVTNNLIIIGINSILINSNDLNKYFELPFILRHFIQAIAQNIFIDGIELRLNDERCKIRQLSPFKRRKRHFHSEKSTEKNSLVECNMWIVIVTHLMVVITNMIT